MSSVLNKKKVTLAVFSLTVLDGHRFELES